MFSTIKQNVLDQFILMCLQLAHEENRYDQIIIVLQTESMTNISLSFFLIRILICLVANIDWHVNKVTIGFPWLYEKIFILNSVLHLYSITKRMSIKLRFFFLYFIFSKSLIIQRPIANLALARPFHDGTGQPHYQILTFYCLGHCPLWGMQS